MITADEALPLAMAISRLHRLDPAAHSPCASAAEVQLRQLGWNMDWHEYAPEGAIPIDCPPHHSGRYLTPHPLKDAPR